MGGRSAKDFFVWSLSGGGKKDADSEEFVVLRVRADAGSILIAGAAHERFLRTPERQDIAGMLKEAWRRLGRKRERVITAVPAEEMTFRSVRLPADAGDELMQMAELQAARFLPLAQGGLITAAQVIRSDTDGQAEVLLGIVPHMTVDGLCETIRRSGISKSLPAASVFGLRDLFNRLYPGEKRACAVVDCGFRKAEIGIVSSGKLLMSRCFSLGEAAGPAAEVLAQEITRTIRLFVKEGAREAPQAVFLTGPCEFIQRSCGTLSKDLALEVTCRAYEDLFAIPESLRGTLGRSSLPLAGSIGLGLRHVRGDELLFSPGERRQGRISAQRKKTVRMWLLGILSLMLVFAGAQRYLDNRQAYLQELIREAGRLEADAAALGSMQRKIDLLESRIAQSRGALEMLKAIAEVIPNDTVLVSFRYADIGKVTIRGQAGEFSSVITFVRMLKEHPVMEGFRINVRYASRAQGKQTQSMIGFEIDCSRGV